MQKQPIYLDARDLSGEPGNELAVVVVVLVLIAVVLVLLKPFRNRPR